MKAAYDLSASDVSALDEASYARWRVEVTARCWYLCERWYLYERCYWYLYEV